MIDNFYGISAAHFLAWKLHICACTRRGIRKALLRPVRLDYRQEISLSMFYLSNGLLVLQVSITQVRWKLIKLSGLKGQEWRALVNKVYSGKRTFSSLRRSVISLERWTELGTWFHHIPACKNGQDNSRRPCPSSNRILPWKHYPEWLAQKASSSKPLAFRATSPELLAF